MPTASISQLLQFQINQFLPQIINVETQLTAREPLARSSFLADSFFGSLHHGRGKFPLDDHDSVVIRDNDIARIHQSPGTNHGNVHRSERRLHRTLRADRPAPYRKPLLRQCTDVAAAAIYDYSFHAMSPQ